MENRIADHNVEHAFAEWQVIEIGARQNGLSRIGRVLHHALVRGPEKCERDVQHRHCSGFDTWQVAQARRQQTRAASYFNDIQVIPEFFRDVVRIKP